MKYFKKISAQVTQINKTRAIMPPSSKTTVSSPITPKPKTTKAKFFKNQDKKEGGKSSPSF